MFVCRGMAGGLVAMLPNVLPILVVFGGMGWIDYPVSIGSMMAASIALGVAVDDTIHYLTWFREDLLKGSDRKVAILAAYRRCGTPTLQAALINGLGLSVFAVSTFTPTREFGLLMLTILLAGGVAELIMMPAFLAGPLGLVFRPRPSRLWQLLKTWQRAPHALSRETVGAGQSEARHHFPDLRRSRSRRSIRIRGGRHLNGFRPQMLVEVLPLQGVGTRSQPMLAVVGTPSGRSAGSRAGTRRPFATCWTGARCRPPARA